MRTKLCDECRGKGKVSDKQFRCGCAGCGGDLNSTRVCRNLVTCRVCRGPGVVLFDSGQPIPRALQP